MKIEAFSPREFDRLETAWRALESGEEMTAFQLYDWYKNINRLWFREHAKRAVRKWVYLLITENDIPIMIVPIMIVPIGVRYKCLGLSRAFYLIGRQGYTDYLNFIYKDFSEAAFCAVIDYLKETYHIRQFYFEQLLGSTSTYRYIMEHYRITQNAECYCAALVLPESFEEYKKSLSKSTRQNIRTAINRQNKNGVELRHELIYDMDESMARILMDVRAQRLGEKRKSSFKRASWKGKLVGIAGDAVRWAFTAKQDVITENCNPWCFLVKDGDRIVSYFWGIRNDYKKEFYVILAGVDKEYAWYSPSLSHLYLFLQELYGQNDDSIRVLDFTRGGERYKEDMGASKKPAWAVRFFVD